MRPAVACHCGQCRRSYSNFAAFSAAQRGDLLIEGEEAITWYVSSPGVRRGFCSRCGSALFWDKADNDFVSVSAGSLDQPSGLTTLCHIYTDDKADFYEIGDSLPRLPQGQEDPWPREAREARGGGPARGD
ncbi:GFA family protein [Pelagibius sp.]|uniref:GFA family protein n=1 Tax=Pelagibius sp. TaxID=1931238 RepID=UPI002AC344D5|nr:GFA family protein [Pelagibius sp.]